MKVKCVVCKKKGYFEHHTVSEFHASEFLMISRGFNNSHLICRNCISGVLHALAFESSMIKRLYEPEIKTRNKK